MRRLALGLVIVVVLVGVGVGAALYFEGPRLLEHAIRYSAHALGYREVRVGVRSLGLRRVELESFSAGPAPRMSAEGVTLEWTGRHLLSGRVASVAVESAVIHGVWTDEGLEIPVVPPAKPGPWLSPPAWDRLEVARARVEIAAPEGPVSVRLSDLDLGAPPGERLRAKIQASIERAAGRLTGVVDLVVDGDQVSGRGNLRSADGALELTADLGESGPGPGRLPDVAGPEDLKLAGRIEVHAEGADLTPLTPSFTASGSLDFKLAEGRLRVRSESLDVAGFGMDLSGLGMEIELTQVSPPAAPPGQRVTIQNLNFGMDVGGGEVRFGVERGGIVAIESLAWRFQGGEISSQGRFDPSANENALTLGIRSVDLSRLVAALDRNDLAVTGTLSGELPLRIEGDRIFAAGGRLTAGEEGGVIRYQTGGLTEPGAAAPTGLPESGSVGGVGLVLDALKNFQYRRLEVGVEGELTGEMTLLLTLEGSNPDVYDGYPFQLNLNLEGPLADVVQGSTTGFRIQDAIEERFQKRGEKR